jgi:RimJ/RimL family protein N-acetyltransferase
VKYGISSIDGNSFTQSLDMIPAIELSTARTTDDHAVLKNGKAVRLMTYRPEDKEELVSMYASMSPEAVRWGLPPYDRARIERWTADLANNITLLARLDQRVVGHLQLLRIPFERRKGVGEVLIYIHQDFQNIGLGTLMMKKAIQIAKDRGFHRLGLTVVADNHGAIKVYEKVGFKKEGIAKDAFYGDDHRYHDEVEMGLLL